MLWNRITRQSLNEQLVTNYENSQHFENFLDNPPINTKLKLIAYYLPQFHPIPENDTAWGRGFTEWTNVTKALPRFVGHYQPHLPIDLGFYDLRSVGVMKRQAELARNYGVHGFCFHYYWFDGRPFLDAPIENLLRHPDIDLRFCINWANENWTRAWDGSEGEVILAQKHSPADDIAFARSVERFLRDPRYIRINGRPLILLYRPALLPDAAATLDRWREFFTRRGLGNPYFVMVQCFGDENPGTYGFDAAAEFPPHKIGWAGPNLVAQTRRFAPAGRSRVLSYDAMMARAMAQPDAPFVLHRGVCPSWDNEARRPGRGVTFVGSTPAKYQQWLAWACHKAKARTTGDDAIVFINAWNEWAEGAHLEPDRHFGYAYLAATYRAIAASAPAIKTPHLGSADDFDLDPALMNLRARLRTPLGRLRRSLRRRPRRGSPP